MFLQLLGCSNCEITGRENVTQETIQSEQNEELPRTVKDAVSNIISDMSYEDKLLVKTTKKNDLIKFHHGWGTNIRNGFGLWGGNKELLKDAGKEHPDDASMVIIEAVWKELQSTSLDSIEVRTGKN